MIFDHKTIQDDRLTVFVLRGELIDRNQAIALLDDVEKAISENRNRMLLNLENLRYINSSGLNILINILTKSRKTGGDVAICCVNKKINELLVITKLNHVFNVCADQDAAKAILNKQP